MNLFKQEETKPINSPVIEMRESSRDYLWWATGLVIVATLFIFFWLLKS